MKNMLCFGDSNTWGYTPGTGARYAWEARWPGRLQELLGGSARILEAGLNGRTTAFDDPQQPKCNGLAGLRQFLATQPEPAWVILMLGTNDLKHHLGLSAAACATGIDRLAKAIGTIDRYRIPQVLIISPPHIIAATTGLHPLFEGAPEKSRQLAPLFAQVAEKTGALFLDAARFVEPSPVDGVHLDRQGHRRLAQAIAERLKAVGC